MTNLKVKTAKVGHVLPKIGGVRIGPGSERVNDRGYFCLIVLGHL